VSAENFQKIFMPEFFLLLINIVSELIAPDQDFPHAFP